MPTGDAECPQEIQHAHHLEHLITNSVASSVVRDDDLEDTVIDISSDNIPAVRTKWKWVAKHIKTKPPSQHQACPSQADIRGTLSNIAQAFNPQAWAKCDESRHARVFKSVHMQHLTAQVRDHEAEIWGLHEQTSSLQREVDRECRRADKAETKLRIIEWMGRRASQPSTLNYRTPHHTFHFTLPCPLPPACHH